MSGFKCLKRGIKARSQTHGIELLRVLQLREAICLRLERAERGLPGIAYLPISQKQCCSYR